MVPVNDQSAPPPGRKPVGWLLLFVLLFGLCAVGIWWTSQRSPHPAPLPEMNRTNLVRLNNRWLLPDGTNLFTGVLMEYYPDGQRESRSVVSNGMLYGLSEGWFTNGQIQIRESYWSNLSDGVRTRWYPNGNKLSEATVARGKIQGVFRHWHQDGTLAEEITLRDGVQEGVARAYYSSGSVRTELMMHDGKMVSQKSWKEGEKTANASPQ